MNKRKYDDYFITEFKFPPHPPEVVQEMERQKQAGNYTEADELFSLGEDVLKGSFYFTCVLLKEKKGTGSGDTTGSHTHDFDEVLVFTGTRKNDPRNLGGEVELWIEDEQYIFTNSCLVFIPRGTSHCPLIFRRIDYPFYFITAGNGQIYKMNLGG
jgi:hypothetical protein